MKLFLVFIVFLSLLFNANSQEYWSQLKAGFPNNSVESLTSDGVNILAGTLGGGILLSTDNCATWKSINHGLTNTRIMSILVAGTELIAGTDGGGVFFSSDYGKNWTAKNSSITNLKIISLVYDGANVYAGTQGGGVFKTNNFGTSWTPINKGITNWTISCLYIINNNLFAGTNGGGVFRTADKGANWSEMNNGLSNLSVTSICTFNQYLFVGTFGGGVFSSSNNGANWQGANSNLFNLYVNFISSYGGSLFACTQGGGIYNTTNFGSNWLEWNGGITKYNIFSMCTAGPNQLAGAENGYLFIHRGASIPVVSTLSLSGITLSSATVNAQLKDFGGENTLKRGVCWNVKGKPVITDSNKSQTGIYANGAFSMEMTLLEANTKYYVRAFAQNSAGTGYGEELVLITLPNPPVCTAPGSITKSSFRVNWTPPSPLGSEAITYNVEVSDKNDFSTMVDGSPFKALTGTFKDVDLLKPSTDYYIRIQAVNKTGVSTWCNQTSRTLDDIAVPEMLTQEVNTITTTTASCNGTIRNTGSGTIVKRGVCWNTSGKPTFLDFKTEEPGNFNTGDFTANLSLLEPNTKYYAAVYAQNNSGYGYGNDLAFVTLPNVPGCMASTSVTAHGFLAEWSAPAAGGTEEITYTLEVATDVNSTNQVNGSPFTGIKTLSRAITGLSPLTKYYWRVNALNATGSSDWCSQTTTTNKEVSVESEQTLPEVGISFGNIYPNPVNNALVVITSIVNTDGYYTLEIYNEQGELAMRLFDTAFLTKGVHTFDSGTMGLTDGLYLIKVFGRGGTASTKLLLSR